MSLGAIPNSLVEKKNPKKEEANKVFLQKIKDFNAIDANGLYILLTRLFRGGFDGETLSAAYEKGSSMEIKGLVEENHFSGPKNENNRLEKLALLSTDEGGIIGNNITVGEARKLLKENGYAVPI